MGLLPTQGDEKRIGSATNLYGTVALSLSSREPVTFLISYFDNRAPLEQSPCPLTTDNQPVLWQPPSPSHNPPLFVIPSVPGFPTSPLSPATTYVVLPKENHMQLTEAATLDRKSGGAEGSAVRHSGAPPLPFHNHSPFVIPTGAEGPAVLRTIHGHVFRRSERSPFSGE